MNRIEKRLYEITQDNIVKDFRDSKDITISVIEQIEYLKKLDNRGIVGVDTGFYSINKKVNGFGKGDLIIIAARPAMGKTSFVLNIAQKALQRGEGVAFFSLEMSAEQLMFRLLSSETSIPLQDLRVGNLTDSEWNRLVDATDVIGPDRKLFCRID